MSSDLDPERFIAAFLAVETPSEAHVEQEWDRFRKRERRRASRRSGAMLGLAVVAALAVTWVVWPNPAPSPPGSLVSQTEPRLAGENAVPPPAPEDTPPVSSVMEGSQGDASASDEEATAPASASSSAGVGTDEPPSSVRRRRMARHGVKVASSTEREAIHSERERHTAKTLADENGLYRRVRDALAQGNPKRALALIDEHAAMFPAGAFAREREAARVQALCALGRSTQARRVVTEAGEGTETLRAAWRKACRSEPVRP